MYKQKKRQKGITLISLVISIIVMLILAGVSINAVIGDNGILTRTQDAVKKSKLASDLEALQLELANHSVNAFLNQEEAIDTLVNDLFAKDLIDEINGQKDSQGNYIDYYQYADSENGSKYAVVKKGENSFRIYLKDDGTYSAEHMLTASGGTLVGGTYEVTQDAFTSGEDVAENDKGKFTIEGDTKVIFNEPLGVGEDGVTASGDMLSIQVKSGANVKIYFNFNESKKAADGKTYYKLTNSGLKRSAIDIENGGELDMIIAENVIVEVNSGFGEDASGNTPGKGGYAGIHVPESATLNLYGVGTLTAIGGNAGNGELATGNLMAGGGGAGAGIGGNGGNGGNGAVGVGGNVKVTPPGGTGENCGNINIYNSVKLYAYGGAGGSGGYNTKDNGAGAGGYPAAGIGGGGAGGAGSTCCAGAGGYSGGSAEVSNQYAVNGTAGYPISTTNMTWQGGGYYFGPNGIPSTTTPVDMANNLLGGIGGLAWDVGHDGGNGGTAGQGGNIRVSKNAKIYAFNGNMYTDGTDYRSGLNQAPIYLQNGIQISKYIHIGNESSSTNTANGSNGFIINLESDNTSTALSGYINFFYSNGVDDSDKIKTVNQVLTNIDMSKQGIGSGAGYIEVSNGTYTEDSTMN